MEGQEPRQHDHVRKRGKAGSQQRLRHHTPEDVEVDEQIRSLPSWQDQLSLRGYVVGAVLGVLFTIIGLKLTLGTAGILPSLNIPGGLLSFAAIKSLTAVGSFLQVSNKSPYLHKLLFQPFTLQENAVMQTFILSMGAGGFGTYLTGMGYQTYLNLGGAPKGTPGYSPDVIYDPVPSNTMPYLMLTTVLGVFMLTQLRRLMICEWRLPFPSGTASGIMLTSFHTANGEAAAIRKVKVLGWTGLTSLMFSMFKWFLMGTDYSCGFGAWPTFGFGAMQYTWSFDWQLNYVGAGMICPHVVNWSMLFGAILSWAFMWPLMEMKAGDWYPAGLSAHDFQGLFGYKVFLVIAILMGEGLYMVLKVIWSSGKDMVTCCKESKAAQHLPSFAISKVNKNQSQTKRFLMTFGTSSAVKQTQQDCKDAGLVNCDQTTVSKCTAVNSVDQALTSVDQGLTCSVDKQNAPHMADGGAVDYDEHNLLQFKETPEERRLRTAVFLHEVIPWWLAPLGYGGLAVLSTIFIPMVYKPVKWYYVLVAYAITPLFALPNSYGCGLTDWDCSSMYAKLALFVFAAWAGIEGNGVIVGLGICGVVLAATSSAATLMGDFRTGYICLAAPKAMFVAQIVGQMLGAVLTPIAFMLFYQTGQVNVPGGPYPSPFADIYRGMAEIGTKGFGALPKYCGVLMVAFFIAGILICLIRDLLPKKCARYVPSPMAMSLPFYIGAASAIDFWLGSVVMHIWECFNAATAKELGPTVGAGLLVGDGLWSIPSSIIAIAGRVPPVCMGFYGAPKCQLPYCIGFWKGGMSAAPA